MNSAAAKRTNTIYSMILLALSLLFYLFFAYYDGYVICVDSPTYIDMSTSREPFYCTFLAILRYIFANHNDFYLTVAIYIQSILAALAAWILADYLRKELNLSLFISLAILAMPLATSFLCRFAALRSAMYSNSILTEGLACPLFLIFIRCLLEYYFKHNYKSLISAGILSFIMISTRKQMSLTLIVLLFVCFCCAIKYKCFKSEVITFVLFSIIVLACNVIFDNGYNYLVHGEPARHSSDNRFIATMTIYTAEREYGEYISDEAVRNIFYDVYDSCEENGFLKHCAGKGWYERNDHFGNNYDNIQIDTLWPTVRSYVYANYSGSYVFLEEKVDELTHEMIASLLPHVWRQILATFGDNLLAGFIMTVAKNSPLLIWYSIIIYIVYIVFLAINIKREGMTLISFLSLLTLVSIIFNVAIVSAVIFCQTRYTIYNMPLFYISLILLLYNCILKGKLHAK